MNASDRRPITTDRTGTANLGARATAGVAWMIAQSLGARGVTFVGQLALAWLLHPQDFGLIGLAYTVTGFAGLIQGAGVKQLLIHRGRHLRLWANVGFWMSLSMGLLSAVVVLGACPVAVTLYGQPELAGLLAVLAASLPIQALTVVPTARLQSELRFKPFAILNLFKTSAQVALTIAFAWSGFGAYSFAWAQLLGTALYAGLLWSYAGHRIRWTVQLRRWRHLLPGSLAVTAASFLTLVTTQGDYVILGLTGNAAAVGLYYFAFSMSAQTHVLFTSNISSVLFPALRTLRSDLPRQVARSLLAARLLGLATIPLSFLLAATAEPGVHAFFPARWHSAVPLIEILSVAMGFRVTGALGGSLMYAQGRFGRMLVLRLAYAVAFVLGVSIGAWCGDTLGVAIAVSAFFLLLGPTNLYMAIRASGGRVRDVLTVYVTPTLAAGLACALGSVAGLLVPAAPARDWYRLVIICVVALPLYIVTIRRLWPREYREIAKRLAQLTRTH